ncbi:type IV pilus biogenesis/stability protein PilW [Agitococcus lubricus]|uniref:Type IV pilus assembly protein PilF n=1 Tax=Agitococcus lubricus TaxID=1077255 RepID=A0A2T5J348_9GAMM|nr:type IV pilus biogenesis/stability protein PilW [Agitococcus lubricus]PTQ90832.1 type IV pilus assembly protein PilF [Agitococcus lubricus]
MKMVYTLLRQRSGLIAASILLTLSLSACTVQEFPNQRKADPVASSKARTALAAEYLQKNQLELAQQQLKKALELDPKSPEAHNIMGALLERDEAFADAEQYYRKAINLRSDYSQAHNNYGVLLVRLKRYKDAIEQFSAAANDLGYERRDIALVYLGQTALLLNDTAKAKNAFERVLRMNARSLEALLELATLAFDAKDYATAQNYYQRFVKVLGSAPQTARSLWLGIRLARQNNDDIALANYESVLKRQFANTNEYKAYLDSLTQGR